VGCTRDDHDHIADHRAEVLREAVAKQRAFIEEAKGWEITQSTWLASDLVDLIDPDYHAAAQGEKDTASPAATSTPQPDADRLAHLRQAVRDYQGEWTTRRVQHLYHAAGYGGQYRHQAREDLAHLHAHGLLVLHDEDPGRRFYTCNNVKAVAR
jgi:hypothetical protein